MKHRLDAALSVQQIVFPLRAAETLVDSTASAGEMQCRVDTAGVETAETVGVPVSNRAPLTVAGGIIQPSTLKTPKSVFQFSTIFFICT